MISFVPLSSGNTVDLGTGQTNAGLGNFVITPLAAGVSTTYTNTPFQISFLPVSYGSTTFGSDASNSCRAERCAQRRGERAFELDRHGDIQPCLPTA